MKNLKYIVCLVAAALVAACQPKLDVDPAAPVLSAPDTASITGELVGDNYVWTWKAPADNLAMQVTILADGNKAGNAVTEKGALSYTHKLVDTNVAYSYIFKFTDGKNFSAGVIKSYTRPGARKCENLSLKQLEDEATGINSMYMSWDKNETATSYLLSIVETVSGKQVLPQTELAADVLEYLVNDVKAGEKFEITLIAKNNAGTSLPITGKLNVGPTHVAFLSEWSTPEEHIEKADDDEACAWIWFHQEYPNGTFLPFSEIKNDAILDEFRVLFWMRDLETGEEADAVTYSVEVEEASVFIKQWFIDGGSLLLWSHACTYVEYLGRIKKNAFLGNDHNINTGKGGMNGDTWRMAIQLAPGDGKFTKDHSTHPLYRGLKDQIAVEGLQRLLPVKGPGYTEDHNCLFFNYPSAITGLGNQDEECYNVLTATYGITPLGTWDSQINWVSQLNVWEAGPCPTSPYMGTALMLGNGGLEFSLRNADGTPDLTMKNNSCQQTIFTIAKNAIEYLKTR